MLSSVRPDYKQDSSVDFARNEVEPVDGAGVKNRNKRQLN